jgi:hypothetical protein
MHDPRTGVWNFDEAALHTIPQPSEFAFDRVPSYISPSGDTVGPSSLKLRMFELTNIRRSFRTLPKNMTVHSLDQRLL